LAVSTGDVATPLVSVVTDTALTPPGNVADAPVLGAVKVTGTFGTGAPAPSVTVAASGAPKAVPTGADWPEPDVAVTVPGAVVLMTSLGGVAETSRVANCLPTVEDVLTTKVYVPLPVTTLLTSAVAYVLSTRLGMFATMTEPRGGAVFHVMPVSVQLLVDAHTCTPVADWA
jgi:hypothetical protein